MTFFSLYFLICNVDKVLCVFLNNSIYIFKFSTDALFVYYVTYYLFLGLLGLLYGLLTTWLLDFEPTNGLCPCRARTFLFLQVVICPIGVIFFGSLNPFFTYLANNI